MTVGNFDLDVTELEDYRRIIADMADDGALSFAGIALKYRDRVMQDARRIVPVKTGQLRDSIQPKRGEASRMGLSAEFEVTAPHAAPIEYGFVHWRSGKFVGPFPYVRPALKKHRRAFIEEIATAAKEKGLTKTAARHAARGAPRFT